MTDRYVDSQVTEKQHRLFMLLYVKEMTLREAAAEMGVSFQAAFQMDQRLRVKMGWKTTKRERQGKDGQDK